MTVAAHRARAAARVPNIFDGSTGGNPLSDLSPMGIITHLFAGAISVIANADPADIQGPEDLPPLFLDFIESLPVVGQLVGLGEAIVGTYDGDDNVLLTIQEIFAPIRLLLQAIASIPNGFPTPGEIADGWGAFVKNLEGAGEDLKEVVRRINNSLADAFGLAGASSGRSARSLRTASVDAADNTLGDLLDSLHHVVYTGSPAASSRVAQRTYHPIKVFVFSGTDFGLHMVGIHLPDGPSVYDEFGVDPDIFEVEGVEYPSLAFPMGASIDIGVANGIARINEHQGAFVLWGVSQGAAVVSSIYNELRSGSMTSRRDDFLGAVCYGNPFREEGVIFPGGTDPGGHGIAGDDMRLVGTESLIWEFARAGDIIAVNFGDADPTSELNADIFNLLVTEWNGLISALADLVTVSSPPLATVQGIVQDILDLALVHLQYQSWQPLAPSDTRTSYQIGWDYISSLSPAYTDYPITGDAAATTQLIQGFSTVRTAAVTASESTITLASLSSQPKNRPWFESPSPFEEVSVPRVLLGPRLDPGTLTYVVPDVTLVDGTGHFIPVRMRDDGIVNEVGLLVLGDDPPPTALYLQLLLVDQASGEHTLIYDFGDIKGDIDTGAESLYEQRWQTDSDILVQAGEVYSVGILPVGGDFRVAGVMREQILTAFTLYPQSSTETLAGLSSLPSTVDEADFNHTFGYRVYVSVGQAFVDLPEDETLLTLTETFNVPNTSSWSSPAWARFFSTHATLYVDSGKVLTGTVDVPLGDANYWGSALATTKLNTDNQSVELTIGAGPGGGGWMSGAYGHGTKRGYLRCKADGTSGACLHVDSDGTEGGARVRIASITDLHSIGTVQATVTGLTAAIGDTFRIDAVGEDYRVYHNDVELDTDPLWTDAGNSTVPVGKSWRHVGWGGFERTTIGVYHRIAGLDKWIGKDISA